jgi:hypothetical protein
MHQLMVALALKQKPIVLSLYSEQGIRNDAVAAKAVNAARLYGHCQVSVMGAENQEIVVMEDVDSFKRAVKILEMPGEHFTIGLTNDQDDPLIMRIDVALTTPAK